MKEVLEKVNKLNGTKRVMRTLAPLERKATKPQIWTAWRAKAGCSLTFTSPRPFVPLHAPGL